MRNPLAIALLLFALALIVLLIAPVIYGYYHTPHDKVFLGITGLYPYEQFYYLSIGASQALDGSLLFADRFGRIPNEEALLNPIANFIALVVKLTGVSLPVAFHIHRICSSLLAILSLYFLSKQFIKERTGQFLSVVVYSLVAGFDGWSSYLPLVGMDPFDNSVPEANVFIGMSGEYYLPLANALFIFSLTLAYRYLFQNEKTLIWCGVSLFTLGAVYIYGLVPAVVIISVIALAKGVHEKLCRRYMLFLIYLALFCLPVVLYYVWLLLRFEGIDEGGWYAFPPFTALMASFGFGFGIALLGIFVKSRKHLTSEFFLMAWVFITVILLVLPQNMLSIQYQMLIGLGAPLAISLTNTLISIADRFRHSKVVLICIGLLFIGIGSKTNLAFYTHQFKEIRQNKLPYYIDQSAYTALQWCAGHVPQNEPVIVSRRMALLYAYSTGGCVYWGPEDINYQISEDKVVKRALDLLQRNQPVEALSVFCATNAKYLFLDDTLGKEKKALFRQSLASVASVVYENNSVTIFRF